jgi:predicted nucleic acid-binding protein
VIVVDTSVWVDHLRKRDAHLAERLAADDVLVHPFVVGELALAGARDDVLGLLRALPAAPRADDDEVLETIRRRRLAGRGVGWVDAHLFAAALLARAKLWTRDRRLADACADAGVAYAP